MNVNLYELTRRQIRDRRHRRAAAVPERSRRRARSGRSREAGHRRRSSRRNSSQLKRMEWIEYSRHVERLGNATLSRDVLGDAHVRNRRIAGQETGAARRLGELMVPMLVGMTERGPDSSGMAVFTRPVAGRAAQAQRLLPVAATSTGKSFRRSSTQRFEELHARQCKRESRGDDDSSRPREGPCVDLDSDHSSTCTCSASVGRSICTKTSACRQTSRSAIASRAHAGTHLVGHTRMATESAVTPENAHPYTAGEDWCLVHNGSLAQPGHAPAQAGEARCIISRATATPKRACRYLHWRLAAGETLEASARSRVRRLRWVLHVPDGHGRQARAGA